jgi:hypothetical protein
MDIAGRENSAFHGRRMEPMKTKEWAQHPRNERSAPMARNRATRAIPAQAHRDPPSYRE